MAGQIGNGILQTPATSATTAGTGPRGAGSPTSAFSQLPGVPAVSSPVGADMDLGMSGEDDEAAAEMLGWHNGFGCLMTVFCSLPAACQSTVRGRARQEAAAPAADSGFAAGQAPG